MRTDDDDDCDVVVYDDGTHEIVGAFLEIFNATHVYIYIYKMLRTLRGKNANTNSAAYSKPD